MWVQQYSTSIARPSCGCDACLQGPPGTGKTKTLVNFIATAAPLLGPGRQILAACASNIAVDNLVLGLRGQGVNVVRLGQPVKVPGFLAQ